MNQYPINTLFPTTTTIIKTKVVQTKSKKFKEETAYHIQITPIEISHYKEDRNVWNDSLLKICTYCKDETLSLIDSKRFNSILDYISSLTLNVEIDNKVIEDARRAYINYHEDHISNKLNKFAEPSIDSLLQLVRFIPEVGRLEHSVYIDEDTGAFGLTLKSNKKSKPILNLLMKANKEITFSFIKKGKGMIKITGRAFFNHNLEDSHEIYNLIRMVKF
jgi:hypothetical protein